MRGGVPRGDPEPPGVAPWARGTRVPLCAPSPWGHLKAPPAGSAAPPMETPPSAAPPHRLRPAGSPATARPAPRPPHRLFRALLPPPPPRVKERGRVGPGPAAHRRHGRRPPPPVTDANCAPRASGASPLATAREPTAREPASRLARLDQWQRGAGEPRLCPSWGSCTALSQWRGGAVKAPPLRFRGPLVRALRTRPHRAGPAADSRYGTAYLSIIIARVNRLPCPAGGERGRLDRGEPSGASLGRVEPVAMATVPPQCACATAGAGQALLRRRPGALT